LIKSGFVAQYPFFIIPPQGMGLSALSRREAQKAGVELPFVSISQQPTAATGH